MDEEQDFAYAVSAKALGHIAETAGRQAPGVVAIRSRSAAVTDGVVHLHLASAPVMAATCTAWPWMSSSGRLRPSTPWSNQRALIFPLPLKTWWYCRLNKVITGGNS